LKLFYKPWVWIPLTVVSIIATCYIKTGKPPWTLGISGMLDMTRGNASNAMTTGTAPRLNTITPEQAEVEIAKLNEVSIVEAIKLAKTKPKCGVREVSFMGSDGNGLTTLPNVSDKYNLCVMVGDVVFVVPPRSKVSTYVVLGWSITNEL